MKILILFILVGLTGCQLNATKEELVASKCRLNVPIIKEQCEAVGVYGTKGGQLQGLPVTEPKGK